MKVSREQSAENREKILSLAASMYREKGFDGIGIADLMKAAGLTHGGFYGHFSSKEDLMSQACTRAVDELLAAGEVRRSAEADPFRAFIEYYLSLDHRNNPGSGCLMAALGADAARQSPSVRHAFTENAKRLVQGMTGLLKNRNTSSTPRHESKEIYEKSLVTLATLVGAQVIARAVDDEKLSKDVLKKVEEFILKNDK
ncbi:MAG: TetR/AcrR family transcriptional regulator [Gammaproteobacteria bacterium]|nr:MAG: TetR/AcrR family transcriptional regulator [Gammaproteobacteria bacterium]